MIVVLTMATVIALVMAIVLIMKILSHINNNNNGDDNKNSSNNSSTNTNNVCNMCIQMNKCIYVYTCKAYALFGHIDMCKTKTTTPEAFGHQAIKAASPTVDDRNPA